MRLSLLVLACLAALAGCTRGQSATAARQKEKPEETRWLCQPGLAGDPCRAADLSSTELRADGTRATVAPRLDPSPKADCFYVYPTVDWELVPGNHEDLADHARPLSTTLAQVGLFGEACALWVPLYRQVTLGTYLQREEVLERGLAHAFADVERAFQQYLARAEPGRKVVLVGHSQGAEMVVRLLRRFFDDDPAMRARLLLAMPIGGELHVAEGQTKGGTLKNVPVCTQPNETGCVVAYRTHAAGARVDVLPRIAPPKGLETACVDPASVDGRRRDGRLAGAVFPVRPEYRLRGMSDVKTPFVVLPGFYATRCVRDGTGYAYLEASDAPPPGDARVSPVDFSSRRFATAKLGLHVLDMQLTQRDLVAMVKRRLP